MDQLSAIRAFVRIAETGSFSAVARELNTTQATISKRLAALEELLGIRLLVRSSRKQSLTEEGKVYYTQCLGVLDAVDAADTLVREHSAQPKGLLRITAPVDFANRILLTLIQEFSEKHPMVKLDMLFDNQHRNMVSEGIDVAIRASAFKDSSLIAKPLCSNRLHVVATPDYLQERGIPQNPDDLREHVCLLYSVGETPAVWTFFKDDQTIRVPVSGKFLCNVGEFQHGLLLAGNGLAVLPWWMIHDDIDAGRLQTVLNDYRLSSLPLKLVYPDRKYLPLKTRAFLDFMIDKTRTHPALTDSS